MAVESVLMVGGSGAGKTTLRQRLRAEPIEYIKTQSMEVHNGIVDPPGEYFDQGRYWHALLVTSFDVDAVLLVLDPTMPSRFPPSFASSFQREVIGVVTKADMATDEQLAEAREALLQAGADPVIVVDSVTGSGIHHLKEVLS